MSKGSRQRKSQTPDSKVSDNWSKIFNKAKDIPELNVEWICYTNAINNIRHSYGLDSKVFTENDQARFAKAHKAKYK
jgi:hypothetical protein|tara:strand:- start:4402 stop:4632 length:231 start_codon:yes stop_codon:yes gene_type:complete